MAISLSRPLVVGITGGVASGKSTIAAEFARIGAVSIDADAIARQVLAPGSEMSRRVIAHFGPDFALKNDPDHVDRGRLARHVFADERARRELGALVHPPIHAILAARIAEASAAGGAPLVAAEIPLLFENHLSGMVDRVLVAACSEPEQVRRLMRRVPGISAEDALRQIRSQWALDRKVAAADIVIDTEQPLPSVLDRVRALYLELSAGAGGDHLES